MRLGDSDVSTIQFAQALLSSSSSAQMAVCCIAKVADTYKLNQKMLRPFRNHAAQPYDERTLRFMSRDRISLWLLSGREKIAYICSDHQCPLQAHRKKGEVDLMWVRGKWYLAVVCDVDFGVVNIATDSLGNQHVGAKMEAYQARYAKRRLRQMSGKQKRFQKHENHGISKSIVSVAECSAPGIALEDLKGIRARVKARKAQRKRLHNESFGQLRVSFIAYKVKPAGVPVVAVDPRNTSWECPTYGRIDRCNRKTQSKFRGMACGHSNNAASNIASRAAVIQPMFAHQCAPGAVVKLPAVADEIVTSSLCSSKIP